MKQKIVLLLIFFSLNSLYTTTSDWVVESKKVYTAQEMEYNKRTHELLFKKTVSPFTQLIFSWNVYRPEKGTFSFFVRVRNAHTKKWDQWHHMLDWGADIQKSYFSRGTFSVYHYARLELEKNNKADAFEIKVIADKKHILSLVKALFVVTSDFTYFQSEPYQQRGRNLSSCFIKGIIPQSQIMIDHPRANALCSPTSVSMLVSYFNKKLIDTLEFARFVYDEGLDVFGSWGFNMAHAFEEAPKNLLFYTTRLNSFADIHALLKKGIPVAVSVRGAIKGAKKEYNNGHLMVIVGYDADHQKVMCYDPAFDTDDQVSRMYDLHDFIVAWERSRRLTYKPQVLV